MSESQSTRWTGTVAEVREYFGLPPVRDDVRILYVTEHPPENGRSFYPSCARFSGAVLPSAAAHISWPAPSEMLDSMKMDDDERDELMTTLRAFAYADRRRWQEIDPAAVLRRDVERQNTKNRNDDIHRPKQAEHRRAMARLYSKRKYKRRAVGRLASVLGQIAEKKQGD